jgi:myosin heavy subunit
MIFTFCGTPLPDTGPTLVIINPYMMIDKLFNDQLLIEYQAYVFLDNLEYKTLPPHVFSLSAFCLWQLFDNSRNQSIVISGESGAGKTENTKFCLKFLASLGKNMKALTPEKANKLLTSKAMKNINRVSKHFGIEDRILGCNEILEAFGNAKTIRNDNSSRFGKLILLLYGDSQTDIKSAFIISYLLEKSRIVSIAEGERNYHIFYYFLKGTSPEEKKRFLLTKPIHQYKYINQSSVFDVPSIDDEKNYLEVHREFKSYFSEAETNCIFTIIASVLNLGNLTFKKELTKSNE